MPTKLSGRVPARGGLEHSARTHGDDGHGQRLHTRAHGSSQEHGPSGSAEDVGVNQLPASLLRGDERSCEAGVEVVHLIATKYLEHIIVLVIALGIVAAQISPQHAQQDHRHNTTTA